MSLLGENTTQIKMQPHPTNQQTPLALSLISHNVKSPGRSKETSARWNKADRIIFQKKVNASIIDIDNTTPSYINSIHLKFWVEKKPVTFRDN